MLIFNLNFKLEDEIALLPSSATHPPTKQISSDTSQMNSDTGTFPQFFFAIEMEWMENDNDIGVIVKIHKS